jgi:hypothetical protein
VGKEGLEPSLLTELVPKTSAYTNSATCPEIALQLDTFFLNKEALNHYT